MKSWKFGNKIEKMDRCHNPEKLVKNWKLIFQIWKCLIPFISINKTRILDVLNKYKLNWHFGSILKKLEGKFWNLENWKSNWKIWQMLQSWQIWRYLKNWKLIFQYLKVSHTQFIIINKNMDTKCVEGILIKLTLWINFENWKRNCPEVGYCVLP